jgi:hypothetical protein
VPFARLSTRDVLLPLGAGTDGSYGEAGKAQQSVMYEARQAPSRPKAVAIIRRVAVIESDGLGDTTRVFDHAAPIDDWSSDVDSGGRGSNLSRRLGQIRSNRTTRTGIDEEALDGCPDHNRICFRVRLDAAQALANGIHELRAKPRPVLIVPQRDLLEILLGGSA